MKFLSRDFTLKEKILLLVLLLLLFGLAYYRFVYVPCSEAISRAQSEQETLQTDLLVMLAKEGQLKNMQKELDELGELQQTSRMESYNNAKAEISLLNGVLEAADSYSVTFSGVTRDGAQIRRDFDLQFKTATFGDAKEIVKRLAESEYRCLLGDMKYTTDYQRAPQSQTSGGVVIGGVRYNTAVNVSVTATFFETMQGGTPDEGLPAEK